MPLEIERKYLVAGTEWKSVASEPVRLCQKYIPLAPEQKGVVRIRIAGEKAFLTLKTPQNGISRGEFEYEIPLKDAEELMQTFCPGHAVDKLRYIVEYEGKKWEVDEFLGSHSGLILAEIELEDAEETFAVPPWVGKEVSGDFHYSNSYLAEHAK